MTDVVKLAYEHWVVTVVFMVTFGIFFVPTVKFRWRSGGKAKPKANEAVKS